MQALECKRGREIKIWGRLIFSKVMYTTWMTEGSFEFRILGRLLSKLEMGESSEFMKTSKYSKIHKLEEVILK